MDAVSVSPSVVRNTVSCGERVRELTGRVAHPQAAHVSMRHFLGLLGNSAKNIVRKAHHNTDWTESVQVLVFYRQEFKVNMRKLIITQTVGSIFHLHCMNITSIFSTTHQHHCAGHCRQYVRRLKRKRAGSGGSDLLGGVWGTTPLCTKTYNEKKIHLTERIRVSWQCGWAHHGGLDTSVIASQNCVCSWAHLPVHVKG